MGKKFVSVVLTIAMCFTLLSGVAFAEGDQIELVPGPFVQAKQIQYGASFTTGEVKLKDSNEVEWIDRLDFGSDTWQGAFYDSLVEASDNDGTDDYLIQNKYFRDSSDNYCEVTYSNGTTVAFNGVPVHTISFDGTESSQDVNDAMYYVFDCIFAVCDAFNRDHPEVFWLSDTISLQAIGARSVQTGNIEYTVYYVLKSHEGFDEPADIRAAGYQTQSSITNGILAQNTAVATILDSANTSSEYEFISSLNQWLTHNNQYNTSSGGFPASASRGLTALQGNAGTAGPVCEGYARALKVLCDVSDIPCVLVSGYSFGEAHMWNYVQMDDGAWYAVDVTWNDPTVDGEAAGVCVSGYESENYLLVGSGSRIDGDLFSESHTITNRVTSGVGGVEFVNGPVLSQNAYEPSAPTSVTELPAAAGKTYHPDLTLDEITLTGGKVMANGDVVSGVWEWAAPETKLYAGTANYKAVFVPAEDGFSIVKTNVEVTVSAAQQTLTSDYPNSDNLCTFYAGPGLEMKDLVSSNLDVLPVFSIIEDEGEAYVEGTVLYSPEAGFVTVQAQYPGVDVNGDGINEYNAGSVEVHTKFTTVPMYRMYDPNAGEHFYTGSEVERDTLVVAGWNYEGVGFNYPALGAPVYRLYNSVSGDHLYTMDQAEIDQLVAGDWNIEGVAFNSAAESEVPQYRLWNPNAVRGAWHFTSDEGERNVLLEAGWQDQGIGWYSTMK